MKEILNSKSGIQNKKFDACRLGFTLIELLVVISIIGILASLTLVSFSGSQKQTRDTERRSDLSQYRNALENYAASNDGLYPVVAVVSDITSVCNGTDGALDDYLASCPADPSGTVQYQFLSSSTAYTIWADLETSDYWVVCSNGKSGASVTAPTVGCNI